MERFLQKANKISAKLLIPTYEISKITNNVIINKVF